MTEAAPNVGKMIAALHDFIGANQMMAYLVMMAARLVELHRVLKPTGSLYLHCDPTASHYLKMVLDTIFGPENFRNEIVWKRHDRTQRCKTVRSPVHDDILLLQQSRQLHLESQSTMTYDDEYVEQVPSRRRGWTGAVHV